ncbi:arylamine N-acetyltransferase, pineal gland isozyme NAT-10-like [Clavelina lepadiformis]|uniref:arylamine N-acetyltransferase, pineal gland isozyme NAT-10-like n=1 Tax=Clavelina lepadiformis TaxID=159417 RepID=UPI0040429658
MNVDKYLERIKYSGPKPTKTDYNTLYNLCKCHSQNVAFDVIDMFGGPRKVLDLNKVYRDIVVNKRGGFCYENNGLFCWLLKELGYDVAILQAQVNTSSKSFGPMFDHMTLLVTCDNGKKWLTDVGFGGNFFVLPLRFTETEEQHQPNGVYRIRKHGEEPLEYVVERAKKKVINGGKHESEAETSTWKAGYKFDMQERSWEDFQKMCDFQQDSEESFLKNNAVTAIYTTNGVAYSWGNVFYAKRYIDSYTEEITSVKTTKSDTEFKEVLEQTIGLKLTFTPKLLFKDFPGV